MPTNAPDVRVRLSAEGVTEVVNAFKRIQAEADRTAKQSKLAGEGHAFLNKQLASMKELLPALAAGAVVAGFIEMAKSGLELADNLGKLQQKTGLASETLSTFSFAARFADVEQESLAKGLVKFTKSMDDYDRGAAKIRSSVQNLFGDPDALKGLDMDQRLQKIVEKLAALEPGAKRTGAAVALFGKAGAELLPLMDELGTQGFDELKKKAEKLGLTFNDAARDAAENLKRSLITLKAEGQGMATQFLIGLAPALANASDAITDATAEGATNGFEVIGERAGFFINEIVAGFLVVGKTIGFILSEAELAWEHFGTYAVDTLKGIWKSTRNAMENGYADPMAAALDGKGASRDGSTGLFMQRLQTFVTETTNEINKIFTSRPAPKRKKTGDKSTSSEDDGGKAAKAALDLQQARADAELKILTAEQKASEAAEKERYDKGLESLREYYSHRLEIVEEQTRAEANAAYGKVLALENTPLAKGELQDEREAKIAQARADWQIKLINGEQQISALKSDQAKEEEALQQKALDFEKKISQAQGDRFAMAKAQIDAEANALDIILRKQGVSDSERQRRVGAFTTAGYQAVDFQQLQQQATLAMDELDKKRQAIDLRVQSGQLFAFQGEQQIMDLEKARLPQLQQIADAMKATAITPEQVQAASDFQSKIDQLSVSSNRAAMEMAKFKQNFEGALTNDLSNWLTNGIDQADSLGDAFRSLASSVVQSLRQIAAQMLATAMIKMMLMAIGMSEGGFLGGIFGGGSATAIGMDTGGIVKGPGTETSDSIPARLSRGEYVVRASAVRRIGVDELDRINLGTPSVRRRGTSQFADGGLVDVQASGNQAPGVRDAGLSATFDVDPVLLIKRMEATPEFKRVFVRTSQANKNAINQALGR
jgi:hypothetical protein